MNGDDYGVGSSMDIAPSVTFDITEQGPVKVAVCHPPFAGHRQMQRLSLEIW
jgi:hypothetical protein